MAITPKLSAKESDRLGLPEGIGFYSCSGFGGMNLLDDRTFIEDNELYVLENFLKIGKGQVRTLWDKGAPFYTAPTGKTILSFFWFSIGADNYVIVFHTDGTAVQIEYDDSSGAGEADTDVGTITTVSSAAETFYNGGNLPACAQWGTQYLLISNNFAANNYWAWDGSVLYTAGSISPIIDITGGGSNYTSDPTVTAFGGSGSGIMASSNVVNGSVVNIYITNPGTGYLPQDVVQFAFSGGASDTTPHL